MTNRSSIGWMKNRRICHGSPNPTDRGRTRLFPNEDAASHDQRASTLTNTATRRLAPRRRAHWLSFASLLSRPPPLSTEIYLVRFLSYRGGFVPFLFATCTCVLSLCIRLSPSTLPTDLRDGAATRRRGDAAPQRALSLAFYIGQTFYPPRILRFAHFSSITYRLNKKSCLKIIPLLLYYTILYYYTTILLYYYTITIL